MPSGIVEQFVENVPDFSSQYSSDISVSYSALNLSGKPSHFPDYGDFQEAFVTRTYGKWWNEAPSASEDYQPQNNDSIIATDFVEIKFPREVYPSGIRIYETYNPGAVIRIWAYGPRGWVKLWEGLPEVVGHTSRLFRPPLKKIDFSTSKFKLELNQQHLEEYTQLDAVLLEGTLKYVKPENVNNTPVKKCKPRKDGYLTTDNLASTIASLGFHEHLRTDWDTDFCDSLFFDIRMNGSFHALPDETIIKIFKYLDFMSLCRCAQVNKSFHRLTKDPLLYRSLNLKPYWHSIDEDVFFSIARKATLLQKLDLSWSDLDRIGAYDCFSLLFENCGSTLTHLRLNNCKFVDSCILRWIGDKCTKLQELSLNSCRYIKNIDFMQVAWLTNLIKLELYRTRIEANSLIAIIENNKNLQHLNVGACVYLSMMDDVAAAIGDNCPNFRSIDLWKNYSLTPVGIRSLMKCTRLQEVDFGWCLQAGSSGEWIGELVRACPDMRKLFVGALRAVTDRDLVPLVKYSPKLEQLDLFGSAITGDICEVLLSGCVNLKLLDVNFCEAITDTQVKRWKQTYPNVVIKKNQPCR